ncbi:hypothetical protein Tco_1172889 [Tanacetum coccineum]
MSLDTRIQSRKGTVKNSFTLASIEAVENVKIVESCNGLLLCTRLGWPACNYIYNESINLFKMLPPPYYSHVDLPFYTSARLRMAFDPTKSLNYKVVHCMTRSSRKELLSPFENPEQKFRSRRRLFGTPSLVESNSPKFNHNFDIEEEVRETMMKTMKRGSEHEDANEHIEKVLEIVDLFHILKITQDQIMLRTFPVSLTGAASRWLRN